jgi:dTDP-glucose 4,6-dehydratase/UDP-glucose 4-epimerase
MKILIVGSKGFIGSHAFSYFSALPAIRCWGADVVTDYTSANYFLIDATNSDYNILFQQQPFDWCINCSGAASVTDSLKNPLRDFTLNVTNVAKLLEAIRVHTPSCKFVNISSAAVYGNPTQLPVKEEAACLPVSPYGIHKRMSENLCHEYFQQFGIQTCSLRIFSAYGPHLQKQILWDVYQKSQTGTSVQLFGTGDETRDFIYISDIVRAMHSVIQNATFNASIYNVASGEQVSIKDLARKLLDALSYKGSLSFSGEVRNGDPIHWQADITKLQSTGFTSQVSLVEGINRYAQWLKEKE